MAAIGTGSYALALWPGQDNFFNEAYEEHPVEYTDIFFEKTSRKAYERTVGQSKFGIVPVKEQGQPFLYDEAKQTFAHVYEHLAYGLGYQITFEAYRDNQYDLDVFQQDPRSLAFAFRQTKERVGANFLNNGFTTTAAMGSNSDGLSLFSASHTSGDVGPTRSNLLTAADMSETTLEDAIIAIMNATDPRGLNIAVMPDCVIVPPALHPTMVRILSSELQNDTANNAVNAIRSQRMIPNGHKVNHYLTDTDAWFVITSITRAGNGLVCYNREPMMFDIDNDFSTKNACFAGYERYSFGYDEFQGIWGNRGA